MIDILRIHFVLALVLVVVVVEAEDFYIPFVLVSVVTEEPFHVVEEHRCIAVIVMVDIHMDFAELRTLVDSVEVRNLVEFEEVHSPVDFAMVHKAVDFEEAHNLVKP